MAVRVPRWRFAGPGGSSSGLVAVRAPSWRLARPGGGAPPQVAVCAPWWWFAHPAGGSCAVVAVCTPWWPFACPSGGSRALLAVRAAWWQFARPAGGLRALVAVSAPWWWFAHPAGSSRALVAVRLPRWRFGRLSGGSCAQRSDSLLRLCLEALFGTQSRVALPRRGCFQALLSGCTILPIISCSSFAVSKYLQMAVNMDGPRCTQGGMLVLYLFGMSKNPRHFSPSPQGRRLVHHLHSGMSRRHQVGYIIFT